MTREQSYNQAFENQNKILSQKKATFDLALQNLSAQNKDFADINRKLASLGASLALTAISGDSKALGDMQAQMTELSNRREQILKENGICEIVYECERCRDTGYIN